MAQLGAEVIKIETTGTGISPASSAPIPS